MLAFAATGAPPEVEDTETLHALADRHVVALDADDRVLMAHPFAAHRAGARVTSGRRTWWGNCAWDGLGIVAALDLRGAEVEAGGVRAVDGAWFHVAVPARPACPPPPRPPPPVVGRHRAHLSDDAALPVGGDPARRRRPAGRAAEAA